MTERWAKEEWMRAIYAIRTFFLRHNIPLEGVRLSVHLPDTRTQWQVKMALESDLAQAQPYLVMNEPTLPPDEIELMGMKISFVNPERFDVRR